MNAAKLGLSVRLEDGKIFIKLASGQEELEVAPVDLVSLVQAEIKEQESWMSQGHQLDFGPSIHALEKGLALLRRDPTLWDEMHRDGSRAG
ncbi:MAG TPA: hypothetical protein VI729_05210 [Anaerolineales bacterium]|nr:hypothetical protein [Anaerolineales bacterium]